jgi:3-dehydro-L-gulonate 2-dehydrogenase
VETGISQVFLCIYPGIFNDNDLQQKLIDEIIDYTHDVEAMHPGGKTYYPGEKSELTRIRNLEEGIPVDDSVWEKVNKILS